MINMTPRCKHSHPTSSWAAVKSWLFLELASKRSTSVLAWPLYTLHILRSLSWAEICRMEHVEVHIHWYNQWYNLNTINGISFIFLFWKGEVLLCFNDQTFMSSTRNMNKSHNKQLPARMVKWQDAKCMLQNAWSQWYYPLIDRHFPWYLWQVP